MITMMKINEQIAFLRKQKGLTQEELANICLEIGEVEKILRKLPLTVREEGGTFRYRLEGSACHIPLLLSYFYK